MENIGEQIKPKRVDVQAEEAIRVTLENVDLERFLPNGPGQKNVAILGAGAAVEVGSLGRYFRTHGLGVPKITAYDKDPSCKILTEGFFGQRKDAELEYRLKDVTDPDSFKHEQYDLVIVRKPDVHNPKNDWRRAFKNGFDHLKPGGVFLATTDLYPDFVLSQLQNGGEVVESYVIPESDKVVPYFNENDLFIAKKGD